MKKKIFFLAMLLLFGAVQAEIPSKGTIITQEQINVFDTNKSLFTPTNVSTKLENGNATLNFSIISITRTTAGAMITLQIESIKELKAEISDLNAQVVLLKTEICKLNPLSPICRS